MTDERKEELRELWKGHNNPSKKAKGNNHWARKLSGTKSPHAKKVRVINNRLNLDMIFYSRQECYDYFYSNNICSETPIKRLLLKKAKENKLTKLGYEIFYI